MYVFGKRQRTTTAIAAGGASTVLAVVTGLEGAVGLVVKYHSGTGTQAPTAWKGEASWDGSAVAFGDTMLTALGTATTPLNKLEAAGPYVYIVCADSAANGRALPFPCDRVKVSVTLGGSSPANDVTGVVCDVWPIYAKIRTVGPDNTKLGMPT